jgi:hypothetical protein
MKNILLVIVLIFLIFPKIFGEIRNGYAKDVAALRSSLKSLKDILSGDRNLTGSERLRIRENIRMISEHLTYHGVTETLLMRFRTISPELFNEVNNLRDAFGRSVHVYVRFLSPEDSGLGSLGMVSVARAVSDSVGCKSEYGDGSASVRIKVTNKALLVLAHEFGHLSYIIPNMRDYAEYYKKRYRVKHSFGELGHLNADPSGVNAYRFEKLYRKSLFNYLKLDHPKALSPLALISHARKNIDEDVVNDQLLVWTNGDESGF